MEAQLRAGSARLAQKQDIGLDGRHFANELINLAPRGRLANIVDNVFRRSAAKRFTAPLRASRSPIGRLTLSRV